MKKNLSLLENISSQDDMKDRDLKLAKNPSQNEKSRINDKLRKLQQQEQGLQECRAEVDGLERSLKYLEERLADSALMDEDDDVLAATASSCVENYSRLAISAPRPWFRLKLGHDLRGIHSTISREQHLAPITRDPRLKGA